MRTLKPFLTNFEERIQTCHMVNDDKIKLAYEELF